MHVSVLREAARRQPFVPFTLRMNDGREFYVPHPDYLAVARRTVIYSDPASDREIFLEPVLIASLEPAPPANDAHAPTGDNP
ncbi:MAG TPA: hypothetical protein VFA26_23380 [Gemmataceae bacterium]|nr:hypothetical protein [Gemmataceae bacterium]